MVITLGILPDKRKLAQTAGQHVVVVFAEYGGLNGSGRADAEQLDGIGGLRLIRLRVCGLLGRFRFCGSFDGGLLRFGGSFGLAASGQSQHKAQAEQK